jgi:hypothetical protein
MFPRLTVEESLGAIFAPMSGGKARGQASNEAAPYIRLVLANRELREYHRYAIWQLALVGTEADVKILSDYVKQVTKNGIDANDSVSRDAAMWSLGHLGLRKVPTAQAALAQMCAHRFWTQLNPKLDAKAVDELVFSAIKKYSLARPENMDEIRALAIDEVKDEERRDRMASQLCDEMLERYRNSNEMRLHRWISTEYREQYRKYFNGSLKDPGPSELAIENN